MKNPLSTTLKYINPHLSKPKKGPKPKLSFYKIFNYILYVIYWYPLKGWQDTYRKLAISYDRLEEIRLGSRNLAYTMINFRVTFNSS